MRKYIPDSSHIQTHITLHAHAYKRSLQNPNHLITQSRRVLRRVSWKTANVAPIPYILLTKLHFFQSIVYKLRKPCCCCSIDQS